MYVKAGQELIAYVTAQSRFTDPVSGYDGAPTFSTEMLWRPDMVCRFLCRCMPTAREIPFYLVPTLTSAPGGIAPTYTDLITLRGPKPDPSFRADVYTHGLWRNLNVFLDVLRGTYIGELAIPPYEHSIYHSNIIGVAYAEPASQYLSQTTVDSHEHFGVDTDTHVIGSRPLSYDGSGYNSFESSTVPYATYENAFEDLESSIGNVLTVTINSLTTTSRLDSIDVSGTSSTGYTVSYSQYRRRTVANGDYTEVYVSGTAIVGVPMVHMGQLYDGPQHVVLHEPPVFSTVIYGSNNVYPATPSRSYSLYPNMSGSWTMPVWYPEVTGVIGGSAFESSPITVMPPNKDLLDSMITDFIPAVGRSSVDALTKFMSILETNHLETLSEIRDISSLIPDRHPLLRVLKGLKYGKWIYSGLRLIDFLATTTLWYEYGLAPSIDSVKEVVSELDRIAMSMRERGMFSEQTLHGKYTYNLPPSEFGQRNATLVARSKFVATFDELPIQFLFLYGLGLDITSTSSFWDIIPFSFVADAFVNIGGRLDYVDSNFKLLAVSPKYYVHSVSIYLDLTESDLNTLGLTKDVPSGVIEEEPQTKLYFRWPSGAVDFFFQSKFDFEEPQHPPNFKTLGSLAWIKFS